LRDVDGVKPHCEVHVPGNIGCFYPHFRIYAIPNSPAEIPSAEGGVRGKLYAYGFPIGLLKQLKYFVFHVFSKHFLGHTSVVNAAEA
jgi:hypothetical protein